MKRRLLVTASVALAVAAFGAGFWLARAIFLPGESPIPPQALAQLLNQTFPDPAGNPVSLSRWRGKPLIVNFWATWCPPCLKEMPLFSKLQETHPEVQFIGIAADLDSNVRSFVAKNPLPYPILLGSDSATSLMGGLGNSRNALPFTVVLDASGEPYHIRIGAFTEAEAKALVAELAPR